MLKHLNQNPMQQFLAKKLILGVIFGLLAAGFGWQTTQAAEMTANEVVTLTNKERTSRGLKALTTNEQLQVMAEAKAKDILAQQYFEHTSPDGRTMVNLAKDAGYAYTLIGENLALGNFANSATLVRGWMNSPGHRANILQTKFTEIGVATVTGTYKGRIVWVGVQEFGRPRNACPAVPESERAVINDEEAKINDLDKKLRTLRRAVNEATTGAAYNEAVEVFNIHVREYNTMAQSLRTKVTAFNAKVNAYNRCLVK